MNARRRALATFGFGIVVMDERGSLVAWGNGVPPVWVDSAAAAEAWALNIALQHSIGTPVILTDCLGLLKTAERGASAALAAKMRLARTWAHIANHLDGNIHDLITMKRLIWMPAHQGAGQIGTALRSDGRRLSAYEWRANRLADLLAKEAAGGRQAPKHVTDLIASAESLILYAAAQLGATTHAANNHREEVILEDGSKKVTIRRDVLDPPKAVKKKPCGHYTCADRARGGRSRARPTQPAC